MAVVTALEVAGNRRKRVRVFLNGRFAFSLNTEVAAEEGLAEGQDISPEQVEFLTRANELRRCRDVALHFLGYRPRSELEIILRLKRRGFADETVEATLVWLKAQGLVDDAAFAQYWRDNRQSFRPRSQRLTGLELKQKGISNEVIEEVTSSISDDDSAYQAAIIKARRMAGADHETFRRRLGDYLRRRGFSYGTIAGTIDRIWRERYCDSP